MAKAKLTFKDLPVVAKLAQADGILRAVAADPALQPTTPPLPVLQTLYAEALAARQEVQTLRHLARSKTIECDAKIGTLCREVLKLVPFIQSASGGVETVIIAAGLGIAKRPVLLGQLPAPLDPRAIADGLEGQILLRWKPVKGRRLYEVEMCEVENDPGNWKPAGQCTKAKLLVKGLRPGVLYQFRVVAIGTAGRSPVSAIASLRAP